MINTQKEKAQQQANHANTAQAACSSQGKKQINAVSACLSLSGISFKLQNALPVVIVAADNNNENTKVNMSRTPCSLYPPATPSKKQSALIENIAQLRVDEDDDEDDDDDEDEDDDEATLFISTDEEEELEAQRIRHVNELLQAKKLAAAAAVVVNTPPSKNAAIPATTTTTSTAINTIIASNNINSNISFKSGNGFNIKPFENAIDEPASVKPSKEQKQCQEDTLTTIANAKLAIIDTIESVLQKSRQSMPPALTTPAPSPIIETPLTPNETPSSTSLIMQQSITPPPSLSPNTSVNQAEDINFAEKETSIIAVDCASIINIVTNASTIVTENVTTTTTTVAADRINTPTPASDATTIINMDTTPILTVATDDTVIAIGEAPTAIEILSPQHQETCGIIYAVNDQRKFIYNCSLCQLRYANVTHMLMHMHATHAQLFLTCNAGQLGTRQATAMPTPTRRSMRKRVPNQLWRDDDEQQHQHNSQQHESESAAVPLVLPAFAPLESSGSIVLRQRKTLYLLCCRCDFKSISSDAYQKHMKRMHNFFTPLKLVANGAKDKLSESESETLNINTNTLLPQVKLEVEEEQCDQQQQQQQQLVDSIQHVVKTEDLSAELSVAGKRAIKRRGTASSKKSTASSPKSKLRRAVKTAKLVGVVAETIVQENDEDEKLEAASEREDKHDSDEDDYEEQDDEDDDTEREFRKVLAAAAAASASATRNRANSSNNAHSTNSGTARFSCTHCDKAFNKASRLAEHARLHTGEKPFRCDICGKEFRIKMRLTEHQLRHRKEKAYKCEFCQLPMATKQDLTLHMRHHNDDRRYKCSICPKAFVRSSDLKIHVRVHTGEKPYVCQMCNKRFSANQNLIVHRRSHLGEKNYKCDYCEKRFMRNIDRKVHHRTHTGEKPFKCEICQRGYSSRVHVRSHLEREHLGMGANRERKKPGPKPKHLREELEQQRKIIEDLQQQLQNKNTAVVTTNATDSVSHTENEQCGAIATSPSEVVASRLVTTALTTANANKAQETEELEADEQQSHIASRKEIESDPTLNSKPTPNPRVRGRRRRLITSPQTTVVRQVSVTVSMQLDSGAENTDSGIEHHLVELDVASPVGGALPEKENDNLALLAVAATTPSANGRNSPLKENVVGVKKERKISSYFGNVAQKAEQASS